MGRPYLSVLGGRQKPFCLFMWAFLQTENPPTPLHCEARVSSWCLVNFSSLLHKPHFSMTFSSSSTQILPHWQTCYWIYIYIHTYIWIHVHIQTHLWYISFILYRKAKGKLRGRTLNILSIFNKSSHSTCWGSFKHKAQHLFTGICNC